MGNRAGRRAQPNPYPPNGGGYGRGYPPGAYPTTTIGYAPNRRNRCNRYPPPPRPYYR